MDNIDNNPTPRVESPCSLVTKKTHEGGQHESGHGGRHEHMRLKLGPRFFYPANLGLKKSW